MINLMLFASLGLNACAAYYIRDLFKAERRCYVYAAQKAMYADTMEARRAYSDMATVITLDGKVTEKL